MNLKKIYIDLHQKVPDILQKTGVLDVVNLNKDEYLECIIRNKADREQGESLTQNLNASLLENIACDYYINSLNSEAEDLFHKAFSIRRNIIYSNASKDLIDLFYVSVSALGAKKNPEIRIILNEIDIPDRSDGEWPDIIKYNILRSFILLCRKKKGWEDIYKAVESINNLRKLQAEFEKNYLEKFKIEGSVDNLSVAGDLISLYNLARMVEITGKFIIDGDFSGNLFLKLKRHFENSKESLKYSVEENEDHFSNMIFVGCDLLIKNCIWYSTRTLGEKIKGFVDKLTSKDSKNPFLELWPSQQEALQSSLLDTARISVLLEMPTSSGKTLLAEFAIMQSYALNPDSLIIYVVPTRALVNQVTLQLRKDFTPLGLETESAVPVFELDPSEDELLKKGCNILVSTPEKLELLIRTKHPVVGNISLVVVDEVHNISDSSRGSTLELFLGNLTREKPNARFLLMSPFIPNANQIGSWLSNGDEKKSAQIEVRWKPSEQITLASKYGKKHSLDLIALPSVHNYDLKENTIINIKSDEVIYLDGNSKKNVAVSTVLSFVKQGNVLLLCNTRQNAVDRAKTLMKYSNNIERDELLDATIEYLTDELGDGHILIGMLKKGIAFHHAGLSQESRFLIERLVESGKIKIICATTTLAQGVNFPIKTVVIESIYRYKPYLGNQKIPHCEFWNIAGRAGRALKDHVGIIVFSATGKEDIANYKKYLKEESLEVLSSIKYDLDNIHDLGLELNMSFVARYPSLAKFFQYLLHAVVISDYETISSEVEDTLRSSLIYHQLNENSTDGARKLIILARNYLDKLGIKANKKQFLELIDGTGFSSMSMDSLIAQKEKFNDPNIWDSTSLFSKGNNNLDLLVKAIAGLPELNLTRIDGKNGELDIPAISGIIKEWVKGASIAEISKDYFQHIEDSDERIMRASKYLHATLVGQVAWGMSALQKIALFGNKSVDWKEVGHIPALMYYGVSSKEAVVLRMAGVPRKSAEELSREFSNEFRNKDMTFKKIRNWLKSKKSNDWSDDFSKNKSKYIWKVLSGIE